MSEPLLVACDPGASGAIAWLKPTVGVVVIPMPVEFEELANKVHEIHNAACSVEGNWVNEVNVKLYIEQVTGYVAPQKKADGEEDERDNRQPGHAMFTFGRNYGAVEMAFRMIGAEVIHVPAKTWQKSLFLKKGERSKAEWKRTLRDTAQRYFQGIKVTLKTADALLILRYASIADGRGGVLPYLTAQNEAGEAQASKTAANTGGLFIAKWQGTPWVLKRGERIDTLLHKASPWDVANIPEGKPR